MRTLAAVVLSVFLGISMAQEKTQAIGKIAVFQSGVVHFNGKPVTIPQLKAELTRLKGLDGTVWYYREHPDQEPPAISTGVIEAVVENRLPISLSTEPDFSTVVLPDGSIRPRPK